MLKRYRLISFYFAIFLDKATKESIKIIPIIPVVILKIIWREEIRYLELIIEHLSLYIYKKGIVNKTPKILNSKLAMTSLLLSISVFIENSKPLMVVPILAPNIIEMPKMGGIKLLAYIFCVKAIIVEEDCVKKLDIIPDKIPNNGFLNFNKDSIRKSSLKSFNKFISIRSILKKISPKNTKMLLNLFFLQNNKPILKIKNN